MNKISRKSKKSSKIEKTITLWETYYKKIGSTYCKALSSEILFNKDGWMHIVDFHVHTSREIERRLMILPLVLKLLAQAPKCYIEHKDGILRHTIQGKVDGREIVVIIFKIKRDSHGKNVYQLRTFWEKEL